ncbi:GTP pyrophosphokinase [Alkalihalophilus pseudofirmus]|uniref:GTP pyrophosphokinase family protein n=1 Tax=Alkalihalophilus pseudofirmus TaxID=79885 RepID=A0AAJ2U4H0_ALKPS|nr:MULTISPECIES: GTP pyrophosphokinase family protein [Alkalihalophilus]MDV2887190.1 GTP pyrophosphokinase family protein [Alkalihalophilus pseudofirmus]MED1602081.1 GTP pyrophosphokinase family protein [Alkalihalophilus marmarensis]OLS34929.1 GTP pyrophosphokinase [Alkalihalophilus pseudofirmus]
MSQQTSVSVEQIKAVKQELTRFMMMYKFALDEMNTKINILQEEFQYIHSYNPIEHTKSRLKSPESIVKKLRRKALPLSLINVKDHIQDIAGIRISCSFISDIYIISEMLQKQKDITVIECKDYIKKAKPNGYQSLHLILEVPVFMSDREERVKVEVQIRTVAMDFWASLEHKIYYKYEKAVPAHLLKELKEAADAAAELDQKMERIHQEIESAKSKEEADQQVIYVDNKTLELPQKLIQAIADTK